MDAKVNTKAPAGVTLMVGAAIALSACGGVSGGGDEAEGSRANIEVLRQAHFDYEPIDTPEELADVDFIDTIVQGRILRIVQGDSIAMSEDDDAPDTFVLIEVEVDEVYRDDTGLIGDSPIYIPQFQGGWMGGEPFYSLDDWNEALPAGTEMILYLVQSDLGMVRGVSGISEDALSFAPHVQGMIIQDRDEAIGGLVDLEGEWEDLEWDEIEARVDAATSE